MNIIKLKDYGFNGLSDAKDSSVSREDSVNNLKLSLAKINEVTELNSYISLLKSEDLNDAAGIVSNLNEESEPKGFILVM
jgi:hypothetical protein